MTKLGPAFAAALAVIAAGAGLVASAQNRTPLFVDRVDLMPLDVTVVDRAGNPVRGLTAADFTISENGRPQSIVSFAEVDGASTPHLIVIAIDDAVLPLHLPSVMSDTKAAAKAIASRLAAGQLASLVFTGRARPSLRFADRAELTQAIDAVSPSYYEQLVSGFSPTISFGSEPRALRGLQALTGLVLELGRSSESRKAIVYICAGAPAAFDSVYRLNSWSNAGEALTRQAREISRAAALGQVNVHIVDPLGDGLRAYLESDLVKAPSEFERERIRTASADLSGLARAFLRDLAEYTGGRLVVGANRAGSLADQLVRDRRAYYRLGYQSTDATADGRLRRLQVRVNKSGMNVHVRRGYWAPSAPR
jgi:VWFA-related protein